MLTWYVCAAVVICGAVWADLKGAALHPLTSVGPDMRPSAADSKLYFTIEKKRAAAYSDPQ